MAFGKIGKTLQGVFKRKKTDAATGGINETQPTVAPVVSAPTATVADDQRIHAGLPTRDYFLKFMMGNPDKVTSKRMLSVLGKLDEIHVDMDERLKIDYSLKSNRENMFGSKSTSAKAIKELIDEITDIIYGKKFKSREMKRYIPALSSLLGSLYRLYPRVAGMIGYIDDYLQEIDDKPETVSVAEVLGSDTSLMFSGNMVDTSIESEMTATSGHEMSEFIHGDNQVTHSDIARMRNVEKRFEVVENLKIPYTDYADPKGSIAALNRIIKYIDILDLQAGEYVYGLGENKDKSGNNRGHIRAHFVEIMKVLVRAVDQWQLHLDNKPHGFDAIQQIMSFEEKGYTVKDALDVLLETMRSNAYEVGKDEILTGGVLSDVNIGESVHRAEKILDMKSASKKMTEAFKNTSKTGNYDEALHKLAEAIGFGDVIVKASTSMYTDKTGIMRYGSHMEKAKGTTMSNVGKEKNLFSKKTETEHGLFDENDAASMKFLESAIKLGIVDFLAMHNDRHDSNYFVDTESMEIKGIDNDVSFGMNTAGGEDMNTFNSLDAIGRGTNIGNVVTYVTPEIKAAVEKISIPTVEHELMPYISMRQRKNLVMRIKALQAKIEESKVIDLASPGGAKDMKFEMFKEYFASKVNSAEKITGHIFGASNTKIFNTMMIATFLSAPDGGRATLREFFDECDMLHSDENKVRFFGSLENANKCLSDFYKTEEKLGRPAN